MRIQKDDDLYCDQCGEKVPGAFTLQWANAGINTSLSFNPVRHLCSKFCVIDHMNGVKPMERAQAQSVVNWTFGERPDRKEP